MADVQLVDRADNSLWLTSSCGCPAAFVRFFAVIDAGTTACGSVARGRERVVVDVVVTAACFDEDARAVLLAAHSRGLQSTPIPGADGRPQGVFSTHHTRPGHAYSAAELDALDRTAREAGAWLDWHRATTLRGALDDLHRRARSA